MILQQVSLATGLASSAGSQAAHLITIGMPYTYYVELRYVILSIGFAIHPAISTMQVNVVGRD